MVLVKLGNYIMDIKMNMDSTHVKHVQVASIQMLTLVKRARYGEAAKYCRIQIGIHLMRKLEKYYIRIHCVEDGEPSSLRHVFIWNKVP